MQTLLTHRQHARAVLRLGGPLIGGHLAAFSIHITDTVMLGWYSVEALAAVVLGGSFYFIFFIVGAGFGFAVMPVVASAAASGQHTQVRRVTRMAMWLSALFCLLAIPVYLSSKPLLIGMGQDPEIAGLAAQYLRIAGWGLIPALQVVVLRSYFSALERVSVVFWITVISAVLNGLLNYALIFGNWGAPELGVQGAAIASVILQTVSLVSLGVYAVLKTPEHALFQRWWRPDWEAFRSNYALGWPIGLTSLAESGLFSATAIMMGWIGTIPLAAHGIALQLVGLSFMVQVGLSNVATIRAAQDFGRKDTVGLRRGALAVIGISTGLALLAMVLYLAVPGLLLGLFLSPDDPARPAVLLAGIGLLTVAALFQVADAGQVVVLGLLRGIQDTKIPMIFAAVSYWLVGMPLSYILGITYGFGGPGIWMGLVVGLSLAWVTMSVRFWRRAVPGANLSQQTP
ncbi:MAG: MATE family efflux transporter [Paracoccaceae bacterium]